MTAFSAYALIWTFSSSLGGARPGGIGPLFGNRVERVSFKIETMRDGLRRERRDEERRWSRTRLGREREVRGFRRRRRVPVSQGWRVGRRR